MRARENGGVWGTSGTNYVENGGVVRAPGAKMEVYVENGGVGRIPGAKMEVCGSSQGRIMSKMEV